MVGSVTHVKRQPNTGHLLVYSSIGVSLTGCTFVDTNSDVKLNKPLSSLRPTPKETLHHSGAARNSMAHFGRARTRRSLSARGVGSHGDYGMIAIVW